MDSCEIEDGADFSHRCPCEQCEIERNWPHDDIEMGMLKRRARRFGHRYYDEMMMGMARQEGSREAGGTWILSRPRPPLSQVLVDILNSLSNGGPESLVGISCGPDCVVDLVDCGYVQRIEAGYKITEIGETRLAEME